SGRNLELFDVPRKRVEEIEIEDMPFQKSISYERDPGGRIRYAHYEVVPYLGIDPVDRTLQFVVGDSPVTVCIHAAELEEIQFDGDPDLTPMHFHARFAARH